MRTRIFSIVASLFTAVALIMSHSSPVSADGGVLAPYDLWAQLEEGHQIAVVTILNKNTAKVDLFISILDRTKQSHEVTFFVPLGTAAQNFYPVEQDVTAFDREATRRLDSILSSRATSKQLTMHVLFFGALFTNGVVLTPLWAPLLLTGCSKATLGSEPEATFQTESSQIGIYGIDESTDLEALINTTGLDTSVQSTLARLRGQRIAVVKLQTQAQGTGGGTGRYGQPGEPGLHLSWDASLAPGEAGGMYSYPLGTGVAWSKPIKLTRVYIVAPAGMDFDVSYPTLGSNQSGHALFGKPHIADYYQIPAYAIDEARGNFGRVWRATYTQSNAGEDIAIVAKPQTLLGRLSASLEEHSALLALAFALIVSLALWLLSWHFLMPRFLGKNHQPNRLNWYWAIIYPAINGILIIFPGIVLYLFLVFGLAAAAFIAIFILFSGASMGIFQLIHAGHFGVSRGKATLAFVYVSLASSGAYLVLALALAKITRII